MDVPASVKEKEEFEEAMSHSFRSENSESVVDQHRRLLMQVYSMGRRHERAEQMKGASLDIQNEV